MPILPNSAPAPPVFFPKTNYGIAKYLNFLKFISILQKKALFFCRADIMEDKFEGRESPINRKQVENFLNTYFSSSGTDLTAFNKNVQKELETGHAFKEKLRSLYCICCWNRFTSESAALWKIYSDFNQGILIKSTIDNLILSFTNTPEEIDISEIQYLDYNNKAIPSGNTNYPYLYKRQEFHYEEEVRLIYFAESDDNFLKDWSKEEVFEGKYLKVNLNSLIQEIIISPYAPKWFFNLVKSVCEKYELEKPIKKSEMTPRQGYYN